MPTDVSPRWFLRRPDAQTLREFIEGQEEQPFSYPKVGATRGELGVPPGFTLDHNRVQLGAGEIVFERACVALCEWQMFPAPWTIIAPVAAAIREGQVLAMQAKAWGVWWVNACRIVYVIDETAGPVRRWGFAYGTLPAHVEQGEERFSVEMLADETVWYDLRAFSRPQYWPVRLAKPLARRLQRRFVRESLAAMGAVVNVAADGEMKKGARA